MLSIQYWFNSLKFKVVEEDDQTEALKNIAES